MSEPRLFQSVDRSVLVANNERRIDLIAQCANEVSRAEFDRKWRTLVHRCADWFSSVPLNPDLYREPGGAFRCTIETAFYAMRLAGGQKFGTNLPSERRRRIEPQYNYGVFLAAICSWLDEPYRYFEVVREADQLVWNPSIHGPAGPWLGDQPYRVTRRPAPLGVERMRTGMLAQALVGSELLSGLDAEVLAEVFGAINPTASPVGVESLTHRVVRQAISTAAEFDRKAQRGVFEPVKFAVPSAIHVAGELEPVVTPAVTPASSTVAASAPAAPTAAGRASPPITPAAPTTPTAQAATAGAVGAPSPPPPLSPPQLAAPTPVESRELVAQPAQSGEPSAVVDPVATHAGSERRVEPSPEAFDAVLKGAPRMIVDFFRALGQDVRAGKAKVRWSELGLVLPKRLIGSYGIASDTLIEHMRRRSLLLANEPMEVTLAPRAGELIQERGL
ncbi:MAG: TraI domain-containing protein [Burkholderia contaminans]|nr:MULTISPECIES: TraI domain-containing protein [Burkholderia cepacia complex]KVR79865.1 type VI secretion protein [Burkholderia vietnamiensis]KVS19439.1 type VI secretion protein [Burkholderia vietnamiensis]MBR8009183.1 TraI domain-containing protein [Burkholderia vietnamiensis]MBR8151518.1 TraI domain-containing protein [Burkholderia vietnamiensis]MBR8164650.1 TraI domain-containing protein [Burkholderia vietnamiensis]